jgi:preprotein translocase subunit SecD
MLTVEPGLSQDFIEVVALIVAMCVVLLLVVQYVKVIGGIFR